MAEKWVMVRVRSETREALGRAKRRFMAGAEAGKRVAELDYRNESPSLDWTIRQLCDLLEKQEAREAKARAKRRKTGASPDPSIA